MASAQPPLGRRGFLAGGATLALGTAGALSSGLWTPAGAAGRRPTEPLPSDVFTLGVASGEPLPNGVVLWTRLAPDPVASDGLGGMPPAEFEVTWEVAKDPRFRHGVRRGTAVASPDWGHSVHAEVKGLAPDRVYFYRFRAGRQISPVGRTRTAPSPGAKLSALSFAFVSCQNYYQGHFTAYDHLAAEDLDLVLHLGDYIYEERGTNPIGRGHLPDAEIFSLADYRVRYGQYKSDPALQAAHASAPWATAPDDHEVENNWGGDHSQPDTEPDQDPAVFRQRRAAAYRAYYENLPFRRSSRPRGPEMQIFRRLTFGDMLQLNMLDTRRFRRPHPPVADDRRWDPDRTILGPEQEKWLLSGLTASRQRWKALGNQVVAMELDHTAGPAERFSTDLWDAYAASRRRLFDGVLERGVDNFVMVTGDAHQNVIGDLKQDFSDPGSRTVGAELLGTSISSSGDGADSTPGGQTWLAENPHMKFYNFQRGYQLVRLSRSELRCDFKVLPYVTRPNAPISTRATAYIENGRPGIAHIDS
ncbi:alkaline phosphatase D family protein [Actinomadura sp. 1N219]|uniref:alkaline phosphatase D family protein n=1 Tax=Actinomadura sp. 1N219 TaxID=3375152 RepID=UPI00379F07D6